MRWHVPLAGTVRVLECFLLFPKCIGGDTRWLEFASWSEEYVSSCKGGDGWVARRWLP